MKKISKITLFIFFLYSCQLCYAQKRLAVGVRFLPSVTMFRYKTGIPIADFLKIAPHYSKVRTAQGIGIVYNPIRKLNIGADLLYSFQGGGFETRKTNLNYLNLPVWIGYNSSPERKLVFTIQSGIQFSYLTSAKLAYSGDRSVDVMHYLNRTTVGVPLAIGVRFKISHSYLMSTQLYFASDFRSLSKTNVEFGVYNYVFPGIRISFDLSI